MAKKLLFSCITTVLALLILEGTLAVFSVRPVYYDDPFVGFASGSPLFREVIREDGSTAYTTSPNKLTWFNKQTFPNAKSGDTYRIFCLGGSTTVGRPYDDKTSFAGWLREFVAAADPDRKCEVINAGGVSYASYRVARLMGELVEYEPDLFVVYTGHNEFLEGHTYGSIRETPVFVRNVASVLGRTRLYSAVYRLANPPTKTAATPEAHDKSVLSAEVDAVLDRTLGPETYTRDDELRTQVIAHFTATLHRIVDIARHAGAEVVFVEPASNLRDCRPFKSQHRTGLSENELLRWRQLVDEAQAALDSDNPETALASFDEAARIDDRVADLHYERGRALWTLRRYDEARAAFKKARDEDVCPLRALTPMREIVKEVARRRNVRLIPFATEVESRSPHGVPGAELFLDHVHPTIAGHQLLADLLLDELTDQGVIHPQPSWNAAARRAVIERVESGLDRRDHAVALRNLAKVLTWAGKFEDADRLALQAVDELPDDYDAHFLAGNACARRQNHREAIAFFEKTVRLNPSHAMAYNNIGNEYFQLGDLPQAAKHFELAVRADPRFAAGYHNLGAVHFELGNIQPAVQFLNTALELEPNRFDANYTLGRLYIQQERFHDAKRHLQRAVAVRPDHQDAREILSGLMQLVP